MDKEDMLRVKITMKEAEKTFKFGETEYRSDKLLELPCTIGQTKVFLRTYVVKGDIPWLVGKVTMEKLGTIIDFEEKKVVFREISEVVKLREDSGGHLRLTVGKKLTREDVWGEGLIGIDRQDRMRKLKKLHLQFGHPGVEALTKLLAEAKGVGKGGENCKEWKEIKDDVFSVTRNCETCLKYKKVPPRPVVGFALSNRFNDVIALDLGEYKSRKFMVMVDLRTKYCQACWMTSKRPEEVIKKLIKHWIALFGSPNSILTDNGREFSNEKFLEMTEVYSIKSMTTAAESPWSNGVCEKTVGLIKDSMRKMEEDGDKDLETILYWTVAARNSLFNKNGFSPNQLVLGRNPNLPGSTENENPAALKEAGEEQDYIRDNLVAMHRSRRVQIMQESNQKIRTALRNQIREHRVEEAQQGDEVYYKRDGEKAWRGPAKVVGIDGKTVVVKHGGDLREICRVHITRLKGVKEKPLGADKLTKESKEGLKCTAGSMDKKKGGVETNDSSGEESDSEDEVEVLGNDEQGVIANGEQEGIETGAEQDDLDRGNDTVEEAAVEEQDDRAADDNGEIDEVAERADREVVRQKIPKLKRGQVIRATPKGSRERDEFRVIGLAGKRKSTKWGDSYNIRKRTGEEKWINLREYEDISEMEDEENFFGNELDEISKAKEKEFSSWLENDVYEVVEDSGQKAVDLRWVITNKVKEGELVCKARLVAKGFQEKDVVEKEAPTCAAETFRLCLAIILMKGWHAKTIDVKTAYLQGERISRDVFVKPPIEAGTKQLWKLRKTIYGLKDAARAWYNKVTSVMRELGGEKSVFEPTVFIWKKKNGETRGVMCVHVDDILFGGDDSFECVIQGLKDVLKVGEVQSGKFSYVGVRVRQTEREIYLDQDDYTRKLELPNAVDFKTDKDMDEREMAEYRGLVGKLNWLVQHTRPDIGFDISKAGKSFQQGHSSDMRDLIKKAKKIKESPGKLRMCRVDECDAYWEVYCDASVGNVGEGMSQIGFTISMKDSSGKVCPIHWKSIRAKRIARWSMEAEALSLVEAAEMVKYLNALWKEIIGGEMRPVIIKNDNKTLVKAIKSKVAVKGRALRLDMAAIHELVDKGDMFVSWVSTGDQLADCLTKEDVCKTKLRNYMFGKKEKQNGG